MQPLRHLLLCAVFLTAPFASQGTCAASYPTAAVQDAGGCCAEVCTCEHRDSATCGAFTSCSGGSGPQTMDATAAGRTASNDLQSPGLPASAAAVPACLPSPRPSVLHDRFAVSEPLPAGFQLVSILRI